MKYFILALVVLSGCTIDRQCTATGDPDADFAKGSSLIGSSCKVQCDNGSQTFSKYISTPIYGFSYECKCPEKG